MSIEQSSAPAQQTKTLDADGRQGIYGALFAKINLSPVAELSGIEAFQNAEALSEASADERVTVAVSVFLNLLKQSSHKVERLDKALLDEHIASLDAQISRQLDAVMHHADFQRVESTWRGVKSLIDQTDFRQNVRIELLDISKDHLVQDFEDSPEIAQSGLYLHTYTQEYDTPGGEPIAAAISNYEFGRGPQDIALLRNISKVSAAAHMPFIGSVGPAFFGKQSMEEVAAIKDIGNYFDRAEYIKWKAFRESDDSRYIGLLMPRVLGRLPYGPDTIPVRSFNYIESVKGPDHEKYLWTNASFAFAANMVKSFITNGWCVQIRGPQSGGAVRTRLLGLYGVDSPMPTTFLDDIAQRREGHDALEAFLDIFNHRTFTQFYRIWRKYSYPATFEAGGKDATSQCLLGLIGLGIPGTAKQIATPISRFLALLSVMRLPTRNAEGISALVKLLAPNTKTRVTPHWPQKVPLAQPASLSRRHPVSLSQGTPLGSVGFDANSQLHLGLFTEDPGEARGWLPGNQLHNDLLVLLRVYLGWRCTAKLQLSLPIHSLPKPVLGGAPVLLGMTGVLGLGNEAWQVAAEETITINLGRYQGLHSNPQSREAQHVAYGARRDSDRGAVQ